MASNTEARKPSDKDALFFYHVLNNLVDTKLPDTDWDKVAIATGLKNARVAKVRYQQIRQKLATPSEPPATPRKKEAAPRKRKTPSKKDANAEVDDDNADVDELGESPTKKAKVKPEANDEDDFGVSDA